MVFTEIDSERDKRSLMMSQLNTEENQVRNSGTEDDATNNQEQQQIDPPENAAIENDDQSTESTCNSVDSILLAARCSESMPSSDSDKENSSLNSNKDSDGCIFVVHGPFPTEYDNTNKIPFPELLKIHPKQLVSGFEFGEATKRHAQENMKTARDKSMGENRKSAEMSHFSSDETDTDVDKPCCSKALSEAEHKTPHSVKRQRMGETKSKINNSDRDFRKNSRAVPHCLRENSDCIEVWVYMIYKEEAALKLRNPRLFNDFKSVTPRMRAILLDWLMEVAEVYHLRRVTYYLSVDYFDRFLSIRPDIPKSLLQLVGITCLYIAAKVEEIYPPNLSEFSYVCDGACKSKEMVSCELLILNSLGWEVILTTPSDWLNLYMQLHFKSNDIVRTHMNLDFNKDFIFPQYSAYQFTRASQLMDLLSLDPGFLRFSYSTIAATAMYYMYGKKIALEVSGLTWEQMEPCVMYMEVFYELIKDAPDPRLHSCLGGPHPDDANRPSTGLLGRMQNGPKNENYSFQTHVASMEYFEKATVHRLSKLAHQRYPANNNNCKDSFNSSELPPEVESEIDNREVEDVAGSLIDDLTSLAQSAEELDSEKKTDASGSAKNLSTDSLLTIDEIFQLIFNQEIKSEESDVK